MIELSRHIECLLVNHNCVIIPDLGGFVTQYMSARLVKEESLYLPPYRSISFNPALVHNDGLLVQSYMQVYSTEYNEALSIISNAVQQLKKELQEQGVFEMGGVGRLILDANGKYDFEPYESGVIAPKLYGLDSFIDPLRSADELKAEDKMMKKRQQANNKKKKQRILRKNKRAYMLSINREFVNYAAAAIVAIAFFFAWTAPISNLSGNMNIQAGIFSVFKKKSEVAAVVKAEQNAEVKSPVVSPAAPVLTVENAEVAETSKYTIILMSHISQKNADAIIQKFHSEGISDVYQMDTKTVRVAYGEYSSLEEAEAALRPARKATKIADAWVKKIK